MLLNKPKMESLIVHLKNQMELNALKSVMKEMGIKYEKFHTRNNKINPFVEKKILAKKAVKATKNFKEKPKPGL
jgi:ribosomal protein L20